MNKLFIILFFSNISSMEKLPDEVIKCNMFCYLLDPGISQLMMAKNILGGPLKKTETEIKYKQYIANYKTLRLVNSNFKKKAYPPYKDVLKQFIMNHIKGGFFEPIKLFLKNGGNVNAEFSYFACGNEIMAKTVKEFLKTGNTVLSNPKLNDLIQELKQIFPCHQWRADWVSRCRPFSCDNNLLIKAIKTLPTGCRSTEHDKQIMDIINYLLEQGADVNVSEAYPGSEHSVLHLAALSGNEDLVTKLLLRKPILKENARRQTVLHAAQNSGNKTIIKRIKRYENETVFFQIFQGGNLSFYLSDHRDQDSSDDS